MTVRLIVPHPTDHHRPPQSVDLGPHAQLFAHEGEARIGRHDQIGPDRRPIVQRQPPARSRRLDATVRHPSPGQQAHARLPTDDLEQRPPDQVIGDQHAQPIHIARAKRQGEGRTAVQHPRLTQVRDVIRRYPVPHAHRPQQAHRMMRQGDLPPVERRIAQARLVLPLDQGDGKSRPRQRPDESQACGSRSDHRDIERQILAHPCVPARLQSPRP